MATTPQFTATELKMIVILAHQGIMARKEALERQIASPGEMLLAITGLMVSVDIIEKAIAMMESPEEAISIDDFIVHLDKGVHDEERRCMVYPVSVPRQG